MKVLIFLDEQEVLLNGGRGGPLGVSYYIYNEQNKRRQNTFYFLNEKYNAPKRLVNRIPAFESNIMLRLASLWSRVLNRFFPVTKLEFDLNCFDVIHFQSTETMYNSRKLLAKYKGKVVLTSHSPVPAANEIVDEQLSKYEKKYLSFFYSYLPEIDTFAFNNADYITFPCEEAIESYVDNWREFNNILKSIERKIVYIPTGIEQKVSQTEQSETRKKYDISPGDFLIGFVGRHNEIKGYDLLKKAATNLFNTDNRFKVISAGVENPLKRLEHPNWKEIGYTKDATSIINACDIYFLPNRETYFDLVMLEAISLGKIVVASRTGGNKYFEKKNVPGIFLYNSLDEAVNIIQTLALMPKKERAMLGDKNKDFFSKNLTAEKYYNSYYEFMTKIGNNNE